MQNACDELSCNQRLHREQNTSVRKLHAIPNKQPIEHHSQSLGETGQIVGTYFNNSTLRKSPLANHANQNHPLVRRINPLGLNVTSGFKHVSNSAMRDAASSAFAPLKNVTANLQPVVSHDRLRTVPPAYCA